jgi:hypothetical protein
MQIPPDPTTLIAALATVLAVFALAYVIKSKLVQGQRRVARAHEAIDKYYASSRVLFDDPAVSMELRETLYIFSHAIAHENISYLIVDHVISDKENASSSASEEESAITSEIERLKRTRPDLAAQVVASMASGLEAMIYRWPRNYKLIDDAFNQFVRSEKKKVAAVVMARRLETKPSANFNGLGATTYANC